MSNPPEHELVIQTLQKDFDSQLLEIKGKEKFACVLLGLEKQKTEDLSKLMQLLEEERIDKNQEIVTLKNQLTKYEKEIQNSDLLTEKLHKQKVEFTVYINHLKAENRELILNKSVLRDKWEDEMLQEGNKWQQPQFELESDVYQNKTLIPIMNNSFEEKLADMPNSNTEESELTEDRVIIENMKSEMLVMKNELEEKGRILNEVKNQNEQLKNELQGKAKQNEEMNTATIGSLLEQISQLELLCVESRKRSEAQVDKLQVLIESYDKI